MKHDWEYKKLGEVCTIERGGSPRPISQYITDDPNGVNWIKIGDAVEGSRYIYSTKEKIRPEGIKKSRFVHKGDFILSNSMSFGKPYILGIDGCIHDGWLVVHDDNNTFNKDFLYYYLGSPLMYRKFESLAVGGVVNNLNSQLVRSVFVAIPPLPIQQQIVAELDKVSEIIEKKKQQVKELDNLAQSIFYDMFGDPVENEKGWEVRPLAENVEEMFLGPFGSALKVDSYVEKKDAFCMVYEQKHAIKAKMDFEDTHYITEEKYLSLQRFAVREGDFIMSCRGTIGKVYQLPKGAPLGIIHPSLMKIRIKNSYNSIFFKDLLIKVVSNENTNGNCVQMAITAKELGRKNIILPPLPLQQSFAQKVEEIEKQKELITASIKEAQLLFDARMDYWFGD